MQRSPGNLGAGDQSQVEDRGIPFNTSCSTEPRGPTIGQSQGRGRTLPPSTCLASCQTPSMYLQWHYDETMLPQLNSQDQKHGPPLVHSAEKPVLKALPKTWRWNRCPRISCLSGGR
ncbi:uncharacterized protein LOC121835324 [Ixodes scapularis]|uniref:uncharacterized protein LOC121835324 n=1 Tax=Ixodes scapularis TaxID=6945 RepID=UPI001A9EA018|nr:uncharacterized protein LOC121835324 [Ixodes scapularis]